MVFRSSTEAHYCALATTIADLIWVRQLLWDLMIFGKNSPCLWCDNKSVIQHAHNPDFHRRTKHVEGNFHFIRENVVGKDIRLQLFLISCL